MRFTAKGILNKIIDNLFFVKRSVRCRPAILEGGAEAPNSGMDLFHPCLILPKGKKKVEVKKEPMRSPSALWVIYIDETEAEVLTVDEKAFLQWPKHEIWTECMKNERERRVKSKSI